MIPIEFYPPLKLSHVSCVTASGTLFAARAAGVLAGAARCVGVRACSAW